MTEPTRTPPLRIALGEYDTDWHDPAASLARAGRLVQECAAAGAGMVALPEMCLTGFTVDPTQAGPLGGAGVAALRAMAATSRVHLVAGVALREQHEGRERLVNSALLLGPDGAITAVYRKQRVFAYGGEHQAYEPGAASTVVVVEGVRIALFICYDLRFPELFRAVAPDVDVMLVIANWPATRRAHWDVLLRARAIENQCYVVGVNRTGQGGGLRYDGGSAAYGPTGERAELTAGERQFTDVDVDQVRAVRQEFPFLRDLRPR